MDAGDTREDDLSTYVVELSTPASGWEAVQEIAARARSAPRKTGSVRFLRVVFVPEDGVCLLVYRGPSARAVREAATSIDLPIQRVTKALNRTKGARP